jgi:hypothetical protein
MPPPWPIPNSLQNTCQTKQQIFQVFISRATLLSNYETAECGLSWIIVVSVFSRKSNLPVSWPPRWDVSNQLSYKNRWQPTQFFPFCLNASFGTTCKVDRSTGLDRHSGGPRWWCRQCEQARRLLVTSSTARRHWVTEVRQSTSFWLSNPIHGPGSQKATCTKVVFSNWVFVPYSSPLPPESEDVRHGLGMSP